VAAPRLDTTDAARRLRAGGVLLLATDTLPGLHARADDPAAVARIFAAKGRDEGKPLLVLAGSQAQARGVTGPWSAAQAAACRRCWPGPFSLILPVGPGIAAAVTAGGGTLAVRVPAWEPLRELLLAVGVPVASTSANLAGTAPAADLAAARALFADAVAGWWDGDGGRPAGPPRPSALVDLTAEPFRVLREGPEPFVRP
jgi:L-threonylcarbamoyladenylate synthase